MKKLSNKKVDSGIKNKIKSFFNNPIPLIIILLISNLFLLFYINSIHTKNKIFVGNLSTEELSIINIHYFTNNKINYFYATNCSYTGKDMNVYNYEIGYYVVDENNNYIPFLTRSENLSSSVALSDLIMDMSGWNVVEKKTNSTFFKNDVLKNLDNLHFVIKASKKKDSKIPDINIDESVEITKLLK